MEYVDENDKNGTGFFSFKIIFDFIILLSLLAFNNILKKKCC